MVSSKLPLSGRRILVTRTRQQASELALQLEKLGATVHIVPVVEIVPPSSYEALESAITNLAAFDWLIFTSANAVRAFGQRINLHRVDSTRVPRIAVIGPATARAVEAIGLTVSTMPSQYIAEALAIDLIKQAAGQRMLLVRAEEARDVLPRMLQESGNSVTIAPAYRNQMPESSLAEIQQIFGTVESRIDGITFTSASTVHNFHALMEAASAAPSRDTALASIGPITSAALKVLGYEVAIEASQATIPSLVESLCNYFATSP